MLTTEGRQGSESGRVGAVLLRVLCLCEWVCVRVAIVTLAALKTNKPLTTVTVVTVDSPAARGRRVDGKEVAACP